MVTQVRSGTLWDGYERWRAWLQKRSLFSPVRFLQLNFSIDLTLAARIQRIRFWRFRQVFAPEQANLLLVPRVAGVRLEQEILSCYQQMRAPKWVIVVGSEQWQQNQNMTTTSLLANIPIEDYITGEDLTNEQIVQMLMQWRSKKIKELPNPLTRR